MSTAYRPLLIGLALIGAIGIAGGGYFYLSATSAEPLAVTESAQEAIPEATLAPRDSTPVAEMGCQQYYQEVFPYAKRYGDFAEYPVAERYQGQVASVDLDSHAVAERFYSYHKEALTDPQRDFAGAYSISIWDYTNIGILFAVVSKADGTVYPFPYVVDWDFDFRPDSNLLIINPIESMPTFDEDSDLDCEAKWYQAMKSYYFAFEDGEFKLLGPEEGFNLTTHEMLEP